MLELMRKFFDDQCSPQEVKEVLTYFNAENETVLRTFINASLEDMDAEDNNGESRSNSVTDKILAAIKTQIDSEKGKLVPNAVVPLDPELPSPQIIP